jgi:hypothetical protein
MVQRARLHQACPQAIRLPVAERALSRSRDEDQQL